MKFKKILSKEVQEILSTEGSLHLGQKALQLAVSTLIPNGLCSIRFDAYSEDDVDDISESLLGPLRDVLQDTGISSAITSKDGEKLGYARYCYLSQGMAQMIPVLGDFEDFEKDFPVPDLGGHSDGVFAEIGFNMSNSFDFSIKKALCSEFMNDTEDNRKISDHVLENGILWDCIFRIDQDVFDAVKINSYIRRLGIKTPFSQVFPDGEGARMLTYMMVFEELQTNHEIQNYYFT